MSTPPAETRRPAFRKRGSGHFARIISPRSLVFIVRTLFSGVFAQGLFRTRAARLARIGHLSSQARYTNKSLRILSKAPEGDHDPRNFAFQKGSRRPLRGVLFEARDLRGSTGFSEVLPGSGPMLGAVGTLLCSRWASFCLHQLHSFVQ